MRLLFGIVALLIVVAIGGALAKRQLDVARRGTAGPALAASGAAGAAGLPAAPGSGEPPATTTERVRDDVQRALEQSEERLRQVDR